MMNLFTFMLGLLALYDPTSAPGTSPDGGALAPSSPDPLPDENATPAAEHRPRSVPHFHPRVLVGYGSVFGAAMMVTAWVWAFVLRDDTLGAWFPVAQAPADLLLGTGAGAVFTLLALQLESYVPSFKRIERMFLEMLDMRALRWHHAVMLGLLAGFPEEMLFRGAMQPVFGLVLTALIFGALHSVTITYFVYATVAGAFLGLFAEWRGSLWAASAAHTTIDVLMFLSLMRTWRQQQQPPSNSSTQPE